MKCGNCLIILDEKVGLVALANLNKILCTHVKDGALSYKMKKSCLLYNRPHNFTITDNWGTKQYSKSSK
jgi:hypothetical protein